MTGIVIVSLALLVALALALSGLFSRHPACMPDPLPPFRWGRGTTPPAPPCVVCAYCGAQIAGTPAAGAPVSHGICPTCYKAEMAKAKQPQPTTKGVAT